MTFYARNKIHVLLNCQTSVIYSKAEKLHTDKQTPLDTVRQTKQNIGTAKGSRKKELKGWGDKQEN